jgi:hypothetical protein
VLAEQVGHPGHEAVHDRRVHVEAERLPGQLAAGEHHRVVARQHALVEQRDPLGAVGRRHHHVAGGRVEASRPPSRAAVSADPVGEERVGAGGVGGRQALVQHRVHVQVADGADPRLPQQPEREHQVGVGVRVDPVPAERGREDQAGGHAAVGIGQVGQHVRDQVDQVVGDESHGVGTVADLLESGGGRRPGASAHAP